MCEKIEKVLEEKTETPVLCTVAMDGETYSSEEFVTILAKDTGDASIFYNTDALTLGMSMKMVTRAFVESMQQLSEEERAQVSSILKLEPQEDDVDAEN